MNQQIRSNDWQTNYLKKKHTNHHVYFCVGLFIFIFVWVKVLLLKIKQYVVHALLD